MKEIASSNNDVQNEGLLENLVSICGDGVVFQNAFILEDEDILELLKTTLHSPKGLGKENIQVEESILKQLAAFANGGCQSGVKYIGNVCVECRKYRWCTNRK